MSEKERILLCMFTSSKKLARELAEGDEILMAYNEEVERAGSNVEIITSYDRMEAERLGGIELGIEQGTEQNRIKTAKEMAEQGCTIEQISNVTKFSFEELKEMGVEPKLENINCNPIDSELSVDDIIEKSRIEIATNLLKSGSTIEYVYENTKVPIKELEKIKSELDSI